MVRRVRQRGEQGGELESLVARIKHLIIFGRLKPRERLIEDELCLQFHAPRHLVRAAFVKLEHLGLVTRRPNKGAIVRDFSVEEVEEIYEMRAMLQAEAVSRMALPLPDEAMQQLAAIHAAYGEAIARQDLGLVCTLNNDFHRTIFGACGNRYLAKLIEALWTKSLAVRCYAIGDPVLLVRAQRDHARMLAALRKCDREALVREVVEHIRPALHAYKRAHGGWDEPIAGAAAPPLERLRPMRRSTRRG